jgi:ComF family protein
MPLVSKKTKTILPTGSKNRRIVPLLFQGLVRIGDVLVLPSCPLCRRFLHQQEGICGACWQHLEFLTGPLCRVTGQPMAVDLGAETISLAARIRPPPYRMARAAFAYDGSAADLIKRFKFSDRPDLAKFLAPHMARAGQEINDPEAVYVPVPLHHWRLLARRFNQSAELCRALSVLTHYPMLLNVLLRIRPTRQQIGLNREGRRRNLSGAFAIAPKRAALIRDKPVILVDDVLTTGATIEACSRTLLKAGA